MRLTKKTCTHADDSYYAVMTTTANVETWVQVNCPHCQRRAVDVQANDEARVRATCKRCGTTFETEVRRTA